VKELINFLIKGVPPELKAQLTSTLIFCADKYAPSKRWYMDTILKVLIHGGHHIRDDVVNSVTLSISESPDMYGFIVQQLYLALRADIGPQPLVQVACWAIGEYGDSLVAGPCEFGDPVEIEEAEVLDTLEHILTGSLCSSTSKNFALNSLMKLSSRFTKDPDSAEKIQRIISCYKISTNVELQQRSVEYSTVFRHYNSIRPALLERMPVSARPTPVNNDNEDIDNGGSLLEAEAPEEAAASAPAPAPAQEDSLFSLIGGLVGDEVTPPPPQAAAPASNDLLMDLLGLDSVPAPQPAAPAIPPVKAINKNGLIVTFHLAHQDGKLKITAESTNTTTVPFTDYVFQAAVPKSIQIMLSPATGSTISAGGVVRQDMIINNPNKTTLKMRVKILHAVNGIPASEIQETVTNFPVSF